MSLYTRKPSYLIAAAILSVSVICGSQIPAYAGALADSIDQVQPKIVKIYGAGGLGGLESYQSGFLVSDQGHVLTASSYVLDTDLVTVVLHDGRRYVAELVDEDPRLEITVLKIDADDVEYFSLDSGTELDVGSGVLAFGNLFGVAAGSEPVSVLRGVVSAHVDLSARRGIFETPYDGPVYVIDAMTNNPGAAGGALTDRRGNLAGMLGKELRSSKSSIWLNYALPIVELSGAVEDMIAGRRRSPPEDDRPEPERPLTLSALGILMVPDLFDRTPPYINRVRRGSAAAEEGLRADDLIIQIEDQLIASCRDLRDRFRKIDAEDEVELTVRRGEELIRVYLVAEE